MKPLRRIFLPLLLSGALLLTAFSALGDDLYNIGKGIDLFGSIYRELTLNYVEKVNPINLMRAGIKGMLSTLDPYTAFIEDEEKADVDMLTTGSYGGLGISVGKRNGLHLIVGILDESVRSESGLLIGDVLLQIDSVDVTQNDYNDLKKLLRGRPGTTVELVVRRPGIEKPIHRRLERKDIPIRSVSIVEILDGGVGYIKLDRFTRTAGDDLNSALRGLLADSSTRAIVLDLRDNPGGLLDAAVDVTEKFVTRGSLIVSTRGRQSSYTREYYSEEHPICPTLPLAVLVNGNSASASEIVAGAVQDLDRGVVIGARTFGKGLVQSVIPLNYKASLKLTTSKYYTPSGRCIQKSLETARNGANAVVEIEPMDSLRTFRTINLQRTVREAGGIEPDLTVHTDSLPPFITSFLRSGLITAFVAEALNKANRNIDALTDATLRRMMRTYLDTSDVDGRNALLQTYTSLIEHARTQGLSKKYLAKLEAVEGGIREHISGDFDRHWQTLASLLRAEALFHVYGIKERFHHGRNEDAQLTKALDVVRNQKEYSVVLNTEH